MWTVEQTTSKVWTSRNQAPEPPRPAPCHSDRGQRFQSFCWRSGLTYGSHTPNRSVGEAVAALLRSFSAPCSPATRGPAQLTSLSVGPFALFHQRRSATRRRVHRPANTPNAAADDAPRHVVPHSAPAGARSRVARHCPPHHPRFPKGPVADQTCLESLSVSRSRSCNHQRQPYQPFFFRARREFPHNPPHRLAPCSFLVIKATPISVLGSFAPHSLSAPTSSQMSQDVACCFIWFRGSRSTSRRVWTAADNGPHAAVQGSLSGSSLGSVQCTVSQSWVFALLHHRIFRCAAASRWAVRDPRRSGTYASYHAWRHTIAHCGPHTGIPERFDGGVLESTHVFFSVSHHAPHHDHNHNNTKQTTNTHNKSTATHTATSQQQHRGGEE